MEKKTITISVVACGILVSLIIMMQFRSEENIAVEVPTMEPTSPLIPRQAFVPAQRERLAPVSESMPLIPSISSRVGDDDTFNDVNPLLETFGNIVASRPSLSVISPLPLPEVKDDELRIVSYGVRTAQEYLEHFSVHSKDIVFDARRLANARARHDGIIMTPLELAEEAVKSGVLQGMTSSAGIWKDFVNAKISFLEKIAVTEDAIGVNKKMIGFEKLTIELLDKLQGVENGSIEKKELSDFVMRMNVTADIERGKFQKTVTQKSSNNIFSRAIEWVVQRAYAAGTSFGGPINWIDEYCTCSEPGYIAVIDSKFSPPPLGSIYVSEAFLSSPLFFKFTEFHIAALWLGNYSEVNECFAYHGSDCDFVGSGNRVVMTGTSF
ncbi:MAG: hypothetical protein NUV53_04590 [Patescibacteria group bacterium]|nr:hypothetical protein [Patescibacteria group bacterium]